MLLGEGDEFLGQVDVEVVPAPHERGLQLLVGGDDQVTVLVPGERLRLALAAVADVQRAEEVRTVPGPEADDAGDVDPAVSPAPHPHHRAGPARRPGPSLRRPQPLARLVLETDAGAQVSRCPFNRGHTSSFHISMAASSRSTA